MPSLETVGDRFESLFRIEGGGTFLGNLDLPANREPPAFQFTQPRRLLLVRPMSIVKVRDVILSPGGERYMVGTASYEDQSGVVLYRVHRLFEATEQLIWKRKQTVVDVLTGQERHTTYQDLGPVWCTVEYEQRQMPDRQMHIFQEKPRLITVALLQEGDLIGTRTVVRSTIQLGVSVCEIQ